MKSVTQSLTSTLRLKDSQGPSLSAGFLLRSSDGYRLTTGLRPLDKRDGDRNTGAQEVQWLVPKGDHLERYPVTVRLALASLFEKLARDPTEPAIVAFADKWGWLTQPISLVREGQRSIVSGSTADRVVEGEPLEYWRFELLAFLERVEVLRAVDVLENADAHLSRRVEEARSLLASRIEWVDGGLRYLGRQGTAYPTKEWILWPTGDNPEDLVERFKPPKRGRQGDLVGPARFQVIREVNEVLRAHAHPQVPAFTERRIIRLFPETLLGAIYMRFVFESDGPGVDVRERQCPACGTYFIHGNAKRRYCSDPCRMAFNYDGRKSRRDR